MDPRSFFSFDAMLTPKIIKIVYYIMLVLVIVTGFGTMFGFGSGGFTFGSFVKGIVGMVVGVLVTRIWCELLIVLFKINENIQQIASK